MEVSVCLTSLIPLSKEQKTNDFRSFLFIFLIYTLHGSHSLLIIENFFKVLFFILFFSFVFLTHSVRSVLTTNVHRSAHDFSVQIWLPNI